MKLRFILTALCSLLVSEVLLQVFGAHSLKPVARFMGWREYFITIIQMEIVLLAYCSFLLIFTRYLRSVLARSKPPKARSAEIDSFGFILDCLLCGILAFLTIVVLWAYASR
jgi:hypothetical protein